MVAAIAGTIYWGYWTCPNCGKKHYHSLDLHPFCHCGYPVRKVKERLLSGADTTASRYFV